MNNIIFFSIVSYFYNLLMGILFFSKDKIKSDETIEYGKLLIANNFGLLVEIFSAIYVVPYLLNENIILSKFILKGILFFLIIWPTVFTYYIFVISNIKSSKKSINDIVKKVLTIFCLISIVIIALLDIHINVGYNLYTYGPACEYAYFYSGILIFILIMIIIIRHKYIWNKKYIPLLLFLFLGALVVVIQYFVPELTLIVPFETFITCVMYHTIENPDVKMIAQLDQAKLAAEKANRAKSDFLSSMSHEIRTPLNAIVGFSDCILEEDNIDDAKNDAKDIKLASENLLEIVNGILDISKIEANKMDIVETDYKPVEVFENVFKLVKPRIAEKPIEMTSKFASDIPYILHGDGGKLRQIITNILTNAAKYTESGSIKFEVNCINEEDICSLVISVEDTGRGIKEEQINKLFTKFERLEEDRNTTLEGTGLGLAITKRFVEMLGGKIIVQSKYGEGSKFTVYIKQKIVSREKTESNLVSELESINKSRKENYSKSNVLVVDDNKINIKVALKLLSNLGIEADQAESGFVCLDKINEGEKYDLILLDDMMPKMSGVETLKKLKEIKEFKTPVIALTANAVSGMKEKYLNDGFDDYLSKPIDKEELRRVLNEYLK